MGSTSLRGIYALKDPKMVREYLGLSLREAGDLCGTSKNLFANWQSGHRVMPDSAITVIGEQIANKLTRQFGVEIGVKIEVNARWHVTAWTQCKRCRAWFKMRRSRDRVCQECRQELVERGQ